MPTFWFLNSIPHRKKSDPLGEMADFQAGQEKCKMNPKELVVGSKEVLKGRVVQPSSTTEQELGFDLSAGKREKEERERERRKEGKSEKQEPTRSGYF